MGTSSVTLSPFASEEGTACSRLDLEMVFPHELLWHLTQLILQTLMCFLDEQCVPACALLPSSL